jgi:hypothetical protein
MRISVALLTFACWAALQPTVCVSAQKKGKSGKPPEVELVEISGRRMEGRIAMEGRVKNVGEKPINKLRLLFDFFAPGHQPLETKRGDIETELLAPGEDAEFHWELPDPPRSVEFEIRMMDGQARELRTSKSGPFTIE